MKNTILVVTPLYKIVGREDLFQDSECVHNLIKYWSIDNEVNVLFNYINGLSKIKKIFSYKKIRNIIKGYRYNCEGVNVIISERQNLIPNQINGLLIDKYISKRIINKFNINKEKMLVTVHLPSTSQYIVRNLNKSSKKIAVIHQTDLQYLRKHPKKFKKYLEKNFKAVFCRSLSIYKEIINYNISNVSPNIITSGVNTVPLKSKKTFDSKKIKFLYVGKLIKRKKLDLLINVLSKIDNTNWELNVIGDGPMKKEYELLVKKLELKNVRFYGNRNHDFVIDEMENSDVFCMPSINETLGLVYLEAMSKGCLTIGTKNEGIDGIIENNINGFLIEPNEESLLMCIKKIYNMDYKEKKVISDNAIKASIRLSEEKVSKNYLNYLLEV